jgi:hypothetical protein
MNEVSAERSRSVLECEKIESCFITINTGWLSELG